jgi:hypothetical protein
LDGDGESELGDVVDDGEWSRIVESERDGSGDDLRAGGDRGIRFGDHQWIDHGDFVDGQSVVAEHRGGSVTDTVDTGVAVAERI